MTAVVSQDPSRTRRSGLSRLGALVQGIGRDVVFAGRQIVRRPLLAIAIVFTLAIGVGPNVAIFSVLKALVLNPLPYPEPDRLVQVWETDVDARWRQPFSYPDFVDHRERSTSFVELGAQSPRSYNLGGDGEAERVFGMMATAGVLRAYGVLPAHGRLFSDPEEERVDRVAVLSHGLWQRRYEGDPDIVGGPVVLNGAAHVVVGIMPESFEFLSPWTFGRKIDVWTPLDPGRDREERGNHWLLGIGRLRDGIDWRSAESELRSIAATLQTQYPKSNARTVVWLNPFLVQIVGGMTGQILVLLGAVGLVLLLACVNVASMLLARGAERRREVAIRSAIGADRRRIIGQLLTESFVLALAGGAAGVVLGYWSIGVLRGLIPGDVPRAAGVAMDSGVLVFAVVLTGLASVLFSSAPALVAARTDVVTSLHETAGTFSGGGSRKRLMRVLATAQLAVAFMLTNGAILLYRSYTNVLEEPRNFDTENVLTARILLSGGAYEESEARVALWDELTQRIDAIPGIECAAVTTKLPIEGGTNGSVLVAGDVYDPAKRRQLVEFSYVSPDYFAAMGIPMLAGRVPVAREGTWEDGVMVVNQAFVDLYWPDGSDPIGQRVRNNGDPTVWSASIVGVVDNVQQWGPRARALPEIYWGYHLSPRNDSTLVVRTAGDPSLRLPEIRAQVSAIDPMLPLAGVRTMADVLADGTRGQQFMLTLVGVFAVLALVLAISGVFGMMSYTVVQRRREIGVRVAFGADRRKLLTMVARDAAALALIGVAVGLALVVGGAAIIRNQLYGVGPLNLLVLATGAALTALVALIASSLPAFRASRIDPIETLRID